MFSKPFPWYIFPCVVMMLLSAPNLVAEEKTVSATKEHNRVKLKENLVDPTRPIGFKKKNKVKAPPKLQAIFVGGGRKEAVIDGKTVKVGGSFSHGVVKKIVKGEVHYQVNGKIRVLKLRKNIFK